MSGSGSMTSSPSNDVLIEGTTLAGMPTCTEVHSSKNVVGLNISFMVRAFWSNAVCWNDDLPCADD